MTGVPACLRVHESVIQCHSPTKTLPGTDVLPSELRPHLSSNEGLIEGVDAQDVLQEGNGPGVAAAHHKLHAEIDGHVHGVGEGHAVVKWCSL